MQNMHIPFYPVSDFSLAILQMGLMLQNKVKSLSHYYNSVNGMII